MNPAAVDMIKDKIERTIWFSFCDNTCPQILPILEANLDKLDKMDWTFLSSNPVAIKLLEANQEKIGWNGLCFNPEAIHLLEKNLDKVCWLALSSNPSAIHILEKNFDKIGWKYLSGNPAAIHLLQQNKEKIDWNNLSKNPEIFEYDYKAMSRPFFEELMANRFHPTNINRFEAWGF